jgi:hypothetical protein
VSYQLDVAPDLPGIPLGSSARASLASFLCFVQRAGVERALVERVRLPVQERQTGFTHQKSLALLAALAAGCRSARDSDFILAADPAAGAVLGLPCWPHSSQLTRHLNAFRPQHVAAWRQAVENLVAQQCTARRRLRRGERVVVDIDQTAITANGRTYPRAAKGHFLK